MLVVFRVGRKGLHQAVGRVPLCRELVHGADGVCEFYFISNVMPFIVCCVLSFVSSSRNHSSLSHLLTMAGAGGSTKFYITRALIHRFGPSFKCRQCDYICAIVNEERGLDSPPRSRHTEDCKARFEKLTEEEDLANTSSDDDDAHHCNHSVQGRKRQQNPHCWVPKHIDDHVSYDCHDAEVPDFHQEQMVHVEHVRLPTGEVRLTKQRKGGSPGRHWWPSHMVVTPSLSKKHDCYDDQPSPKRFCVDHCHKGLTGSPGSRASSSTDAGSSTDCSATEIDSQFGDAPVVMQQLESKCDPAIAFMQQSLEVSLEFARTMSHVLRLIRELEIGEDIATMKVMVAKECDKPFAEVLSDVMLKAEIDNPF